MRSIEAHPLGCHTSVIQAPVYLTGNPVRLSALEQHMLNAALRQRLDRVSGGSDEPHFR